MYCWVPSHVSIYGNEKVDKKAKESLDLVETDFKIPFVNFKPLITSTSLTNGNQFGTGCISIN